MTKKVQSTGQSNNKSSDQERELKNCIQKEGKKRSRKKLSKFSITEHLLEGTKWENVTFKIKWEFTERSSTVILPQYAPIMKSPQREDRHTAKMAQQISLVRYKPLTPVIMEKAGNGDHSGVWMSLQEPAGGCGRWAAVQTEQALKRQTDLCGQ